MSKQKNNIKKLLALISKLPSNKSKKKITKKKNPYYGVIDIETTLDKNIVQIALSTYSKKLENIKNYEYIVKGDKQDYYKQISLEKIKNGNLLKDVIKDLQNNIDECEIIIGHNVSQFDIPILSKNGLKCNRIIHDTMKCTKDFVNVKNKKGHLKQPNLKELYVKCFKEDPEIESQHNATYDIKITWECYKYLTENKLINFINRKFKDKPEKNYIDFGRFKGQTVDEVYKTDPSYLKWMLDTESSKFEKYKPEIIKLFG